MKTAEEEKVIGNKAFAAKDYDKAITHYTSAIKLDHKNHVYYSNRSVSYVGIGKFEEAVIDAKECIRLNPTFIKGYYRLATSETEMNEFDMALSTIKRGLKIEPKNSQLVKLNRLVKAKKASAKRAASSPTNANVVVPSCSQGDPLDPTISKEVLDLQNQLRNTVRDYNIVNVEIEKLQKQQKMNEITSSELEKLPTNDDKTMYRSIGKMFMKSSRRDIYEYLEHVMNDDAKKVSDFVQKKGYLERRMKSQHQNIMELTNTPALE